ncbi:kinase-like domain-containing protein [Rhizophagus irregularis DAOM 181602=DAOM 197198]|nr:kinase-like domain-containing protein [Rhizophagus irregularis DAOM 181602=DAOM 197198]
MSGNNKMQDTKNINKWINRIEEEKIITKKDITEISFDIIVDKTNDLIFRLLSKGIEWKLLEELVIDYFNNHNINLQEIYNWSSYNQNSANSIFLLGYFNNRGIETSITQNFKKAFYWYEKAANNGNIMAVYNLGRCYKNGMGVKRDCNRAFKLLKQSAEGGYLRGITMLGVCYEIGVGTKIDKQKAFELYQKSANLGELVAQYNLGIMYEFGKGITKDINKAIYWYGKCAEQGDQDAENRLVFLQHY